LNPQSPD
jgi:transcription antitermination factor NusG